MSCHRVAVAFVLMLGAAVPCGAQTTGTGTRAVAFDTVVGVQDYFDDAGA